MTTPTINPADLPAEVLEQFGTIVNAEPSAEQQQWEQKIEEVSKPFTVKVRLTPSQKSRLERIASDKGLSIEETINEALVDLVETNVSAPTINSPSWAKAGPRVTG